MYYPEDYDGFQDLEEDYNPFIPPFEGAEPTNWMINLSGTY